MNRKRFQELALIRVRESQALLETGHWPGAYYLIGYAIECALKACVSKQVKRHDFPDKDLINKAHTHRLEILIGIAGLKVDFDRDIRTNKEFDNNWGVVKDWNESVRYDLSKTQKDAIDLFHACTKRNGILPWIKRRW